MTFAFLKSPKFYIPAGLVTLIVVWIGYSQYQKAHPQMTYETVKAERGTLIQTVDATGKIESANDLSLRFDVGGTMDLIRVKEGNQVKAGDLLANLRLADLNAAVAQASANLNQKLAGATNEERAYYKAAVDAAQAAWDQAKTDAQNGITAKEAAFETAKNNMKLAEGGENSRIVVQAYEDTISLLNTSLSVFDDSITQADNILGIDNIFANETFENVLSILNLNKLNEATVNYYTAKTARDVARNKITALTLSSPHSEIDATIDAVLDASSKLNKLLVSVSDVLNATLPGNELTQSALDAKKTTINTTRNTLNTNYTNLINQRQDIADAKNSYSTYQIAYNKAQEDLDDARFGSTATIAAKEAAYNQAVSNWQTKTVAPREVDVAYYRASLAQAVANRDKAIIKAPIDGVIAKVNKKRGESVSAADVVIQMVSPHYEVKVDIPETDVSKVTVADTVNMTLDAFGEDVKFTGKIMSIEPASTEIQDVVYYKVTVALDPTDKEIKSGMTANVIIGTGTRENVVIIPMRAIRTRNTDKYVRVLENNVEVEKNVKVGMRGNDGKVEILEGINEGENIIVSVKTQ